MRAPIYTVGHSTRTLEKFLGILQAYGITELVDVRTIPKSRHNPQFNKENLPAPLLGAAVAYRHMPGLGGLRHPRPDSINTAWRNSGFRGFADYMQTPEFRDSLEQLIQAASTERAAVMCAEAVPWRCHRSLIGDALVARGIPVIDILSESESRPHSMTAFAIVDGDRLTYPGRSDQKTLQFSDPSGSSG